MILRSWPKRLRFAATLLLMALMAVAVSGAPLAEAASWPYVAGSWTASGPTTVSGLPSVVQDGSSIQLKYDYSHTAADYSGAAWTFDSVAPSSGSFSFNWNYSLCHSWFMAVAQLTVYADGPSGRVSQTLYNGGGVCGTNVSGSATVQLVAGGHLGFQVYGSNFDYSQLLFGTVTVSPSDTTAPVLSLPGNMTVEATGPSGAVVTYNASASDPDDAVASFSCSPASGSTFPIAVTTVNCTATDTNGNTSIGSFTVKVQDTTPPQISGSATVNGQPYVLGTWVNQNVTVTFTCSDSGSGIATCPASVTLSNEGANQSVSGTAVDRAGNSASTTVSGIDIDKTPPTVSISGPAFVLQGTAASAKVVAADALSGLAKDPSGSLALDSSVVGSHTVSVTAIDKAGNSASASFSYSVWGVVGPFAPVVKNGQGTGQFKAGSTIPVKFQLTDGSKLITTATGTVNIGSASAAFRWDSTAQQYVANVKTGATTGSFPVTLTVDGVGSTDIATVTIR